VYAVFDRLNVLRERYEHRFGEAPVLRAVLHGGPVVVVGETGGSRGQITYLGDVLNVTARIEALAKTLGVDVLISASLLAHTKLPSGITATSAGPHQLKGIAEPVGVFALSRSR